jgi:hypothetical protein
MFRQGESATKARRMVEAKTGLEWHESEPKS